MNGGAPTGVFTLSFDVELAWGEFYRGAVDRERLMEARRTFPALLRLLERRRIPATFAVVGHLLLDGCDGHHCMPRPRLTWGPRDWYEADPGTDEARDPHWYAPSLVAMIRNADPGHDVGAHGFSHVPLNEPGVTREVARAEIAETARLLRNAGCAGTSFVFPRNGIRFRSLLAEQRFACYRGVERRWYRRAPRLVRRLGHLADQAFALRPPVGRVRRRGPLVEVPSSMLFLSRIGVRRYLPISARVARARRGIDDAAATGRVFHLWMHAEDFVPDAQLMLGALDSTLRHVQQYADRGRLTVRTMADLAVAT